MLDSLYANLFKPAEARFSSAVTWQLWLLLGIVLAFNAAGAFSLGAQGVLAFTVVFLLASAVGWYWFSASIDFLARLMGGQGTAPATLSAIAQSFWPLLLSAPVIVLQAWLPTFGELISLLVTVWVLFALVRGIRQVHNLSWRRAVLCLILTVVLTLMAPLGIVLWPLLLGLGT
ncbi:MAG TPA: Yip1 family protein [Candidatus Caenarcaniphilales bacterium]